MTLLKPVFLGSVAYNSSAKNTKNIKHGHGNDDTCCSGTEGNLGKIPLHAIKNFVATPPQHMEPMPHMAARGICCILSSGQCRRQARAEECGVGNAKEHLPRSIGLPRVGRLLA